MITIITIKHEMIYINVYTLCVLQILYYINIHPVCYQLMLCKSTLRMYNKYRRT
jgi:hypothetical protein